MFKDFHLHDYYGKNNSNPDFNHRYLCFKADYSKSSFKIL